LKLDTYPTFIGLGIYLRLLLALLLLVSFAYPQSGRKRTVTTEKRPNPTITTIPSSNESPTTTEPEEDVIKIRSNLVPVLASVVDSRGHAVTDLKLTDFELKIDGEPKPISDLSRSETPVKMALLFDSSGSLSSAREFQKQAAIRFLRSVLRPVDQCAIYSVSTTFRIEQPLTNNVPLLVRTIENFGKPEGGTALLDSVAHAADYLRLQQGRRVIIIVSDGADTTSDIDFDSTLRRAQTTDCQVYAIQTGQSDNINLYDLTAARRLQELTVQTGGTLYVPKSLPDLDTAFAQISADLSQQYVLSYYPTEDQIDGRFHTISLNIRNRPDLKIRTRKGYYSKK
jgi:Ca-activated chloride channel homolog